jgi:hypothetical protein
MSTKINSYKQEIAEWFPEDKGREILEDDLLQ